MQLQSGCLISSFVQKLNNAKYSFRVHEDAEYQEGYSLSCQPPFCLIKVKDNFPAAHHFQNCVAIWMHIQLQNQALSIDNDSWSEKQSVRLLKL